MRTIGVFVAAVLAAITALVVAVVAPAGALTSPYKAVTGSADPVLGGLPIALEGNAVILSGTASGILISAPVPGSSEPLTVSIAPPTAESFAEGADYTTGLAADVGVAQLDFGYASTGCGSAPGTMHLITLATDGGGNVTAFAADYTFKCDSQPTVSGSLRYDSTTSFRAVLRNQLTWDFGTELTKTDGIAKSFVFTNRGSGNQGFSGLKISQSKSSFSVVTNTCKVAVASGSSCHVTVVPHPQTLFSSTGNAEKGTLVIQPTGLPTVRIPLTVEGSDSPAGYLQPGPGYIKVHWSQLPAPSDRTATGYRIYRGTSKTALSLVRTLSASNFTSSFTVTPGRTYYFAIQPLLSPSGTPGDRTPVMAAIAWPKYTPGMYHRLPSATRFVSGHVVRAGRPLTLKVLGQHGVPGSGVSAVALNLTADSATAATSLRVYPAGSTRPKAADLDLKPGTAHTNMVLAKIGRHGKVVIATSAGSVRVSVDVSGYFSGSGLAHKYGKGAALQEYAYPGTLLDTKAWGLGALRHGYYYNTPVNFRPSATPHVTSLLVEITAFGSKGSGTITGFTTNHRASGTSVLSYRPNASTSNTAIVRAGLWYDSNNGLYYPSVSFLNRGRKPVQLIVSILGYFDDDTFSLGERYTPTAPKHVFGKTLHAGTTARFNPGSYAKYWTFTFNAKITATKASRTTALAIKAIGGGVPPKGGQLQVPAHTTTAGTTLPPTGVNNWMSVHNVAGTVTVNMWSFGRFDAYPMPRNTPGYTTSSTNTVTATATPVGARRTQMQALPLR